MRLCLALAACSLALVATNIPAAAFEVQVKDQSVHRQMEALIAADRSFAEAATGRDIVTAFAAMFHDDVVMPSSDGTFARGKAQALEALRANPFNVGATATWAPLRGGVSGDGRHGFTMGLMDVTGRDGTSRKAKYLAYWLRSAEGWRVRAFKRVLRPEGAVEMAMMAPSLPPRSLPETSNERIVQAYRQSLIDAEKAFSDEAQRIGLGPAFARNGHVDATNLGSGPGFDVGAITIGQKIGGDSPESPVKWNADDAIVAASGDFGITFGMIRPNGPPPEGRPGEIPFFTIWRRDSPDDRWLYIAE